MTTYRLDELAPDRGPSLALVESLGRRCEFVTAAAGTWRGTLAGVSPKPRTAPGCYVVALRVRGQLRHTPALPGDTVITIYPKEAP